MDSGSQSSEIFSAAAASHLPLESFVVDGISSNGQPAFWCYFCSKLVSAEPDTLEGNLEMVCPDCHGGFIEAMTGSQPSSDVHHSHRRRRRRGGASSGQSIESLESVYSHHPSQRFQLQGQFSRENSLTDYAQRSDQEYDSGRMSLHDDLSSHRPLSRIYVRRRAVSEIGSEGYDYNDSFIEDSDTNVTFSGNGGLSDVSGDFLGDGQTAFDGEMFPNHQDDESHVGGDSESGLDNTRMGFYEWDSMDDEDDDGEWEGGGDDDDNGHENREGMGESRGDVSTEDSSEQTDQQRWLRFRRTRWRYFRRQHQRLAMNADFNLHDVIPRIFEHTGENNIDENLQNSEGQLYIGHPGDYLDARGFEQLLQQLAESDNVRRGAPPAAESAIERLPVMVINESHVADNSSVCAICKDSLSIGDQANQLPCLHLYHLPCILPWLRARNSCPVCRYELPTDDQAYEEQKRQLRNRPDLDDYSRSLNQQSSLELSADPENVYRESNAESSIVPESREEQERSRVLDLDDGVNPEHEHLPTEITFAPQAGSETLNCTEENNNVRTSQTPVRCWIALAAGPILSVVGFAMFLYFQNSSTSGRGLQSQQRHQLPNLEVQQACLNQNSRRRWWQFFRR
eukprot:TRINITY_DN851_c0_g2_i2.p1 TRINITY_DN851_c0_g2~~TRINITY_DN851_c0_g2_i2.p1  ORF type:complete len:625 (+),score=140.82 TRINITY_DN851_c0_g2_i2:387-2261(+)